MNLTNLTNTVITGQARHIRIRPIVLHVAVSLLIICSLAHALASSNVHDQAPPSFMAKVKLVNTTHAEPASKSAQSGIAAATAPPVTLQAGSTASLPASCSPDVYAGPTPLDLSMTDPGVSQVIDATHYYKINGFTAAQARQQITACAPKLSGDDDFTGYTAYRMSWVYNYDTNDAGQCTLSMVKIGMHIGEVLPSLAPSPAMSADFAAKWQVFMTALDSHEHGHITLNEQYAAKLLADLQSMPATDCGAINQSAKTIIDADIAALNQANTTYDSQTNHGATQGAILP